MGLLQTGYFFADLIPILPFDVLRNYLAPGWVTFTWTNARLVKVTLNRAMLHLRQSTARPVPGVVAAVVVTNIFLTKHFFDQKFFLSKIFF